MSEFDYTQKETYKIIRENTDESYKNYTDSSNNEDIIQTSDGTIWGIKYNSTDNDKSNYENVSIHTYSEKDGKLVANNDSQLVKHIADLIKEYQVFGEKRNIIKEDAYVITENKNGYNNEIRGKGLVNFLINKLSGKANNTDIKRIAEGFISGENNSDYIVKQEGKKYTQTAKPTVLQPEPENRNKIETLPEDIHNRTPDNMNFFEGK